MIQASELRLGNKVNRLFWNPHPTNPEYLPDVCEVCIIKPATVNIRLSDKSIIKNVATEKLEPIPLTEEWLLKAGFKKQDSPILPSYSKSISDYKETYKRFVVTVEPGNQYMNLREGHVRESRTNDEIICVRNSDRHGPFYVHQLQNIFFAVTGQELTFQY